jgi:hypothetical protein
MLPTIRNDASTVQRRADFIKKNVYAREKVLILSNLSGIYCLEASTASPINLPGPTEMFLKKDYQDLYQYLRSRDAKKIIHDKDFHDLTTISILTKYYRPTKHSPDNSIIIYEKI